MGFFDDPLKTLVDEIVRFGLEYFRRYYGPYRARVLSNKDPSGTGRVRVQVPRASIGPNSQEWILPMMAGSGPKCGVFWPPEENDYVWVFFDNGDPEEPACYLGGWYAEDEIDEEFDPEDDGTPLKRGMKTPGGHFISFSDKKGEEKIRIRHKDGTIIEWDENNKVKMGKDGGTFEPMMRGTTVKQWLETHTHPHSWGPTGAPIQPFPQNGLSEDTETS